MFYIDYDSSRKSRLQKLFQDEQPINSIQSLIDLRKYITYQLWQQYIQKSLRLEREPNIKIQWQIISITQSYLCITYFRRFQKSVNLQNNKIGTVSSGSLTPNANPSQLLNPGETVQKVRKILQISRIKKIYKYQKVRTQTYILMTKFQKSY